MSEQRFDVIIAGAGPAGAATAVALARRGISAAVLELRSQRMCGVGESLNAVAQFPLRELGVWDEFASLESRPTYLTRSTWGGTLHDADSLRRGLGPDFHVDRPRFDEWLSACAVRAGVRLIAPARIQTIESHNGCYRVAAIALGVPLKLEADFLIDATGRRASLSRRLGAQRDESDGLIAVARWFSGPDRAPMILVEPADHGYWYTAPTPDGGILATFFTDRDGPFARAAREPIWSQALASAPETRARLSQAVAGKVAGFAASPGLTSWSPDERCLPVGDAAVSLDPISGAGLTLALRSGLEAARAVAALQAGVRNVGRAYRDGLGRIFELHLQHRRRVYRGEAERRRSEFWQRPR